MEGMIDFLAKAGAALRWGPAFTRAPAIALPHLTSSGLITGFCTLQQPVSSVGERSDTSW